MTHQIPKTIKIISILGLSPLFIGFIATFKLPMINPDLNKFLINCSLLYSGLILSFLGGCLFGFESIGKKNPSKLGLWLAVTPSIWALIALQTPNFSASILAVGFLVVFEFDRKAHRDGNTPNWWISLRLPLTATVVFTLSIIGFYHGS